MTEQHLGESSEERERRVDAWVDPTHCEACGRPEGRWVYGAPRMYLCAECFGPADAKIRASGTWAPRPKPKRITRAWVDPHCGYNPSNCPYGDACADCRPTVEEVR